MTIPRTPIKLGGRVRGGRVHLDDARFFTAALPKWEGLRVTITVAPELERRRDRANNYYRGVVLAMLAEHTGHTPDELHEEMRLAHNGKTVVDVVTGEEIRIGLPTHTLSIAAFSDYLDKVMLWAATDLGMTFPPPRRGEDWRKASEAA